MDDVRLRQVVFAAVLILMPLGLFYFLARQNRGHKYPPGPRGLPIIGNILQLPGEHLATHFRTIQRRYGALVWLNMAGTPMLLIGDMDLAKDLLDKRSARYSSRLVLPYVSRYVDPIGTYWAFHGRTRDYFVGRKLTVEAMSSVRAGLTEPLQQFEALLTIQNILDQKKEWFRNIDRLVISITLTSAFGAHCPTGDEPELDDAIFSINEVTCLFDISASIINFFPFLDWIPGPMPWRVRAQEFRRRDKVFYTRLIREAISGKASGISTWASKFAKEDGELEKDSHPSRFMSPIAGAAIETTGSSIKTVVLACLLYPEWVAKAQKQIDEVVGSDCLPTFSDRPHLPFIEAVVREALRWRPPARIGVPHFSTADDVVEYNGSQYFIPAGTTVIANGWAIDHDAARYPDPDRFDPERFLDDAGELRSDYETCAFGFGRRVCPGSPLAERTIWIAVAMLLWAFDIRKSDEPDPKTGRAFQYSASDAAFHGSLTNAPYEFPAVFSPRSTHHAEVARREWEACEKDLNIILPARKD